MSLADGRRDVVRGVPGVTTGRAVAPVVRLRRPLTRRFEGAVRYVMVHLLSGAFSLYIVNEYPKSGGSWLGQMLAAALDVPFPRNRFPVLRSSIMQGHYLDGWGMRNVIVTWRDGRDVMVSFYHHCLFRNDRENAGLVERVRRELPLRDPEDVRANLPAFIDYAFSPRAYPRFSWSDFVRRWRDAAAVHTRYETLRADTAEELRRLVAAVCGRALSPEAATAIAHRYSFEAQSGRKPGVESRNSFMRKGLVGDWKVHFSRRARETFDRHAGAELIALGYERDRSWVEGGDDQDR